MAYLFSIEAYSRFKSFDSAYRFKTHNFTVTSLLIQ